MENTCFIEEIHQGRMLTKPCTSWSNATRTKPARTGRKSEALRNLCLPRFASLENSIAISSHPPTKMKAPARHSTRPQQ